MRATILKLTEELRAKRPALLILLFMSAVYFFAYFQRIAVPGTIFNELQSDLGMSASGVAFLGAIYLYVYAGMQPAVGIMADRLGAARVFVAGGALLSVGSIIFPLIHSLPLLYATRALVGLGSSVVFLCIVKEIDLLFSTESFGVLLGATVVVGYSGGLAGTLPLERAVNAFGWRPALLAVGVACCIALYGATRFFRKAGRMRGEGGAFTTLRLKEIFVNARSIPVLFSGSVTFSVYFLLQATVGKKMLQDCCGFSSPSAASFTLMMVVVVMVGAFSSGFISRFIGNRRRPLVIGSTASALLSTILLALSLTESPDSAWILPAYVFMAIAASATPIFACSMKEVNPSEAAGTAVGLLNGVCYALVGAVSTGAGLAMDHFKGQAIQTATAVIYPAAAYRTIFIGCMALALCSFVSSFFVQESHGRCVYGE